MAPSMVVVCPDLLPMLLESAVAPYREPAVQCLHLVEELRARGWQLSFVTPVSGAREPSTVSSRLGPVRVWGRDAAGTWWSRLRHARRLYGALRDTPGDLVLRCDAPGELPRTAWPVGRPQVQLLAGERVPQRHWARGDTAILRGARLVMVPSTTFRARLRSPARAQVLPPAFPVPAPPRRERRAVAWVGPLRRDSGSDVFLDLADAFPDTPFQLCAQSGGDAAYAARVQARCRTLANVALALDAPYPHVVESLGAARFLVSTARGGDLAARSVLAWLHGAVVVSLVSDPDALLRERGLGWHAVDPHALFVAVQRGLQNDDACALVRERARRYAEEAFDVRRVAERFERRVAPLLRA